MLLKDKIVVVSGIGPGLGIKLRPSWRRPKRASANWA